MQLCSASGRKQTFAPLWTFRRNGFTHSQINAHYKAAAKLGTGDYKYWGGSPVTFLLYLSLVQRVEGIIS
jgi:hypothetical protein